MSKIKFINNALNLASKGYILEQVYEISDRKESTKSPGKFIYLVKGPGLPEAGIKEWEEVIFDYFQVSSKDPEYQLQLAHQKRKGGGVSAPASAPVTAQATAIAPAQANAQAGAAAPAEAVRPTPSPTPDSTVMNASNMMVEFASIQKKLDQLINVAQLPFTPSAAATIQGHAGKDTERDVLLAGLARLNFETLNLKLIKTNGKLSLVLIIDSMPPLSFNAPDVTAADIVSQALEAFGENNLIVSSIKEWVLALKELKAEKEEEVKKLKSSIEKTKAEAGKKPKAAKSAPAPAEEEEPSDPNEPELEPISEDDEPEPEESAPFEGAVIDDNAEALADPNAGLSAKAQDFQLE